MITVQRFQSTDSISKTDRINFTSWEAAEAHMDEEFKRSDEAVCLESGRYKTTGENYLQIKSKTKIIYQLKQQHDTRSLF